MLCLLAACLKDAPACCCPLADCGLRGPVWSDWHDRHHGPHHILSPRWANSAVRWPAPLLWPFRASARTRPFGPSGRARLYLALNKAMKSVCVRCLLVACWGEGQAQVFARSFLHTAVQCTGVGCQGEGEGERTAGPGHHSLCHCTAWYLWVQSVVWPLCSALNFVTFFGSCSAFCLCVCHTCTCRRRGGRCTREYQRHRRGTCALRGVRGGKGR